MLAVISEYNPFHNGHAKHLELSKKITNADFSIAIITGNFVQRGDTSIVDKWTKAEMALKAGFDIVIELPTVYAISSAENFANGAIKILNTLGIVDYLSFGSEIGDIASLNNIANILYKEPKELSMLISQYTKTGVSFPTARQLAVSQYLGNSEKCKRILSAPNNILGIEYLKSLKQHRSSIRPLTIQRDYDNHNSTQLKNGIASGAAIRLLLSKGKNVHTLVPSDTYELLEQKIRDEQVVLSINEFEKEIIYTLRRMSIPEIASLPDVTEGLENRIKLAVNNFNTLPEIISAIKTKRFTQTRIQRIMLYALLGITQKDMNISQRITPYIRVLGFNKHGKKIISAVAQNNPKAHVIVSVKKFMELNTDNNLRSMLAKDILATNIYTLAYKKNPTANLDYTHKIIEI